MKIIVTKEITAEDKEAFTLYNTGECTEAFIDLNEEFEVEEQTRQILDKECFVSFEERCPVYISVECCKVIN